MWEIETRFPNKLTHMTDKVFSTSREEEDLLHFKGLLQIHLLFAACGMHTQQMWITVMIHNSIFFFFFA